MLHWYHHSLQHSGVSRMEKSLGSVVYWPWMSKDIRRLCTIVRSANKQLTQDTNMGMYLNVTLNWDLNTQMCGLHWDPFNIQTKGAKGKINKKMIRTLTMIDPATAVSKLGSSRATTSIHREYHRQYPCPVHYICNNGSELKKDFKRLIGDFGIKYRGSLTTCYGQMI